MTIGCGLDTPPWVNNNEFYWQKGRHLVPKSTDQLPILVLNESQELFVGAKLQTRHPHGSHKGLMVIISDEKVLPVAKCVMPKCNEIVQVRQPPRKIR